MSTIGFLKWSTLHTITHAKITIAYLMIIPTVVISFFIDYSCNLYLSVNMVFKITSWFIMCCMIENIRHILLCIVPCIVFIQIVSFILDNMVLFSEKTCMDKYPHGYILIFVNLATDYLYLSLLLGSYIYFTKYISTEVSIIKNDNSIGIEVIDTITIKENTLGKYTDTDCIVCLEEYKINDGVKILSCKHYFHTDCIEQWFDVNRSCPMCRANNV
jgi:hypothetical protein